ncbi:MAG: Hsp20/alpha crystallin family protein [Acidobacteria bacterium]|jgi:HSP20 family protein|nr:Hsp20/alpha crystallin family protein [Acidobacteriota bacterium]
MNFIKVRRPYGDLWDMYNKINRLFEQDYLGEGREQPMASNCWVPLTDIYETKDDYVFKVELPGIAKEDVKVEVNGDTLNINGERKEDKDVKHDQYHRLERVCGSFMRNFQLPKNADGQKMSATIKEGILELHIPKREESKPKAIPINIA